MCIKRLHLKTYTVKICITGKVRWELISRILSNDAGIVFFKDTKRSEKIHLWPLISGSSQQIWSSPREKTKVWPPMWVAPKTCCLKLKVSVWRNSVAAQFVASLMCRLKSPAHSALSSLIIEVRKSVSPNKTGLLDQEVNKLKHNETALAD